MTKSTITAGILFLATFLFYILCLNHVDVNEIGITYDSTNGKINIQEHPGWYVTTPLVKEISLTTKPFVVIFNTGAVVINQKVVRFKKEGILDFIQLQGFSYNDSGSFVGIMAGYAFSGKNYPFLEIIQDSEPVKN